MNILKKLQGKTLYGLAKTTALTMDVLIGVIEAIVGVVSNIRRAIGVLIGMGGCLFLLLFAGPFGLALLLNPPVLLTAIFLVVFPMLGTKFISYLKYIRYATTEYLYDRASYYTEGKSYQYETFSEYGNEYKRMKEEERRKRQERYRREQQRQWEERFNQWYGNQQTYSNPTNEFKEKYEKSCDILGLDYGADEYQVKLAYRKQAKKYHPDINQAEDATEKFQKINNAYEFLSPGNIERYEKMA